MSQYMFNTEPTNNLSLRGIRCIQLIGYRNNCTKSQTLHYAVNITVFHIPWQYNYVRLL